MIKINKAYEVLSDEKSKEKYEDILTQIKEIPI
ncbi:MAG: hypothetical protein CM1200mP11_2460 [Nitrosopumilaceae archaeon]|nr:MAG: hypothetical protein CM1200mP11_2460 [Nitrosopumilaceae archaeon]